SALNQQAKHKLKSTSWSNFASNYFVEMIFFKITYRKRPWQVLELLLQRPHMILVNMCISNNMDKITWN
ncbi:hypothetical protein PIB30_113421, partial [Stylosanthes scabra]|nr:hypothetical protein [Stylosanthes scabra]